LVEIADGDDDNDADAADDADVADDDDGLTEGNNCDFDTCLNN
jgi:hypothetical protein